MLPVPRSPKTTSPSARFQLPKTSRVQESAPRGSFSRAVRWQDAVWRYDQRRLQGLNMITLNAVAEVRH